MANTCLSLINYKYSLQEHTLELNTFHKVLYNGKTMVYNGKIDRHKNILQCSKC